MDYWTTEYMDRMLEWAANTMRNLVALFSWDNYSMLGKGNASNAWVLFSGCIAVACWICFYFGVKELKGADHGKTTNVGL